MGSKIRRAAARAALRRRRGCGGRGTVREETRGWGPDVSEEGHHQIRCLGCMLCALREGGGGAGRRGHAAARARRGRSRFKAQAVAGCKPDRGVGIGLQVQCCPSRHKVHIAALQGARLAARAHAQAALLHQQQQRAVGGRQLLRRARRRCVAPQLKLPARRVGGEQRLERPG